MIYVDVFTALPGAKVVRYELEKQSCLVSNVTFEKSLFAKNDFSLEEMGGVPCLCKVGDYVDGKITLEVPNTLFAELQKQDYVGHLAQLFKLSGALAQKFVDLFGDMEPVYEDLMTRDAGTESASVFGRTDEEFELSRDDQESLMWSFNEGNFPEYGDLSNERSLVEPQDLLGRFILDAQEKAREKFGDAMLTMLTERASVGVEDLNARGTIPVDGKQVFLMMKKALLV